MVLNNVMYIDLCVDRLYTCTYLDIPGDDEDVENTGEGIQKQAEYQANKPVTKFCKTNAEKMDINELVELMVETIAVKQPVIRINKYDFPYDVVRSRLEKIDFHTMEYVLECLRNNTTKVRNIRSYMLTTLYNASVTCSNYYKAEVNHDFYGK